MENEINFEAAIIPSQTKFLSFLSNVFDIAHFSFLRGLILAEVWEILHCILDVCQRLTDKGYKLVEEEEAYENEFFISHLKMLVASFLLDLNQIDQASKHMNENLELQSNNPNYTFLFYLFAGNNWFKLKQYEKSLRCLQIALGIRMSLKVDFYAHFNDYFIAMMHSGVGACLLKLGQYGEPLIHLDIAVHLKKKFRLEENHFRTFAFNASTAYLDFEVCLQKL